MCSSLLLAVQRVVCSKNMGIRVTQDASNGDVFVHDCPAWAPHNAEQLLALRPNARVTIIGSAVSLSGFVITVREPPDAIARSRARRLTVAFCMAAAASAFATCWRFWPEIVAMCLSWYDTNVPKSEL